MKTTLKGGPELQARLKALKLGFKPAGRDWGNATVRHARSSVPQRTGRLRQSFRVKNATQKRATVAGHFTAFFIDAGTKAHLIKPRRAERLRWEQGGRTVFAKAVNHPRTRAQPFRQRAAEAGLRDAPIAARIIKAWNDAA